MADAIEVNEAATSEPAAAGAAEPDLTGRTLSDFHVLRRLGQGGMGRVYLAEQISLKRNVALKLLKPELAANEMSLKRFKMEAEAVARTTHANIVQVYTIGQTDGLHYMALEYVEGRSLREYLEKKGPPEVLFGLSILRQVASALQRAGELGIVHRDIKPDNILLTRKGEAKVADFGLSRIFDDSGPARNMTQTSVAMGTPLYMSPEQIQNPKGVDPRTDIYSLGITCYHMFAGSPPFRGENPYEVAVQHVQKEPESLADIRPDLPAELCALIHKMMAKKPVDRPQTAREVVREASRIGDALLGITSRANAKGEITKGMPALTEPLALPPHPRRWVILGGVCLVALAALIGYFVGERVNVPHPAPVTIAPPAAAPKALTPQKEHENDLLRLVRDNMKSGNPVDAATGLKHAMELSVIYLKERRLDEAEEFFRDLDRADAKGRGFKMLSQLGKACVLAFQDKPAESNKLFLGVTSEKLDKGPLMNFWRNDPALREVISRALQFNYANAPEAFPKQRLDVYRLPPMPQTK